MTVDLAKISWNDTKPKYDLRDWAPDHEKMGQGTTLTNDELKKLYEILAEMHESR